MGYAISLAIGIILLIISLFLLKESMSFIKNGERTKATVIELEKITHSKGATYKPVFKFNTILNQEIIYRHNVSSSPPTWKVGDETTVIYDLNDPQKVKLLSYFGVFSWTIILMAIAMPLIVIGGGYYIAQSFLK
jgi:Protein of unknown function (DUF3592)